MVIQWGCLAKCQGTRKGGFEFRRVSATAAVAAAAAAFAWWLFVQKFHVRGVSCVSRTAKNELSVITPAMELSEKFSESRIYQPCDIKRETTRNTERKNSTIHFY